eukprot:TRINITY_DN3557_c0_g1_i2.p1 TRINITY_DN3557_c0_g1~~TRINITY_DN3557_c0_g1_i2.p1  ORF type:complete len:125 (-),score=41.22 TRINITY_DN3557_c0_g1_i2:23-397(-)
MTQNPKPILKKSPVPKPSSHLAWDEENLDYNEKHKTATMKIDEPKTPYAYPTHGDQSDEELDHDHDHDHDHGHDHDHDPEHPDVLGQAVDKIQEEEIEKQKKKEEFEKKRRAHYNEGKFFNKQE